MASKVKKVKLTKTAIKQALKEIEFDATNIFYAALFNSSTEDYLIMRAGEEILTASKDTLLDSVEKALRILVLAKIKRLQNGGNEKV